MNDRFATALGLRPPTYRAAGRVTPTLEGYPQRLYECERRLRAVTVIQHQSELVRTGRATLSILV